MEENCQRIVAAEQRRPAQHRLAIALAAMFCSPLLSCCSQATTGGPRATAPTATALHCTRLEGTIGMSQQWGSGWIDFEPPQDFQAGSILRLTVGGSARKILVRLLAAGESPDTPAGLLGEYQVPENRAAEVPLSADTAKVRQVSVHGGSRAWSFDLGASNGPASLAGVALCR